MKENHHVVPCKVMKKIKTENQQKRLDGVVEVKKLSVFTREGVVKAVTEFVVCNDQVG